MPAAWQQKNTQICANGCHLYTLQGLIGSLCSQKDEAKLTCYNQIVCALKTLYPAGSTAAGTQDQLITGTTNNITIIGTNCHWWLQSLTQGKGTFVCIPTSRKATQRHHKSIDLAPAYMVSCIAATDQPKQNIVLLFIPFHQKPCVVIVTVKGLIKLALSSALLLFTCCIPLSLPSLQPQSQAP